MGREQGRQWGGPLLAAELHPLCLGIPVASVAQPG